MSYKKRFIRNDFATSRNFQKNKKLPFKIGEKIRNITSKVDRNVENLITVGYEIRA